MPTHRRLLIAVLILLTLAQAYVVYAILWFSWLTVAPPAEHCEIARVYAVRWELISIPIGLLWLACVVALFRTRNKRAPDPLH